MNLKYETIKAAVSGDKKAMDEKNYSVTLPAGTHTVPSLVLSEGDTEIGITGTGSATFTYRKGAL